MIRIEKMRDSRVFEYTRGKSGLSRIRLETGARQVLRIPVF